jgi:hypothetical protein
MMAFARCGVLAAMVLTAACGQKGPPLAPLRLVPAAAAEVSVARVGGEARLRLVLPAANANGPGASVLDRVEIYAITVAPGTPPPPNRLLLTQKFVVGTIAVKPPVDGEAPPPAGAAPDVRPSTGERVTFVEVLTEDKLKPVVVGGKAAASANTPAPAAGAAGAAAGGAPPAPGGASAPPAGAPPAAAAPAAPDAIAPVPPLPAAVAPVPPLPTYAVRIYAVRGLTKRGRTGPPSSRVELPLVEPPPAPPKPSATVSEKAIALAWTAPAADAAPLYNIYKIGAELPLNGQPLAVAQYERPIAAFGAEECFVVRSVVQVAAIAIESAPSDPVCVTPRDTFPPAAPKGLSIVAGPGAINLSWDANSEPDLAGYLVLRGEAPGETLQPLMPAPIAGTSFEDKTVKAGVRYVYAIVAVDKATPPNTSAQSARAEETAR